jgi:tetratricopeptide (TPR) repeat protein
MLLHALAIEPSYARASAHLALTYHIDLFSEFTASRNTSLDLLLNAARKTVAIDSAEPLGHVMLTYGALWSGDNELAISEAREAIGLNPSGTMENVALGAALDFAGKSREAVALYEHALRLNPRPLTPYIEVFATMRARAQLGTGQFEAALESTKKAVGGVPGLFEAHLLQASALAHLGRQSEASAAFATARGLRPHGFALPASWSRYKDASTSRNILDGLRKAGWEG